MEKRQERASRRTSGPAVCVVERLGEEKDTHTTHTHTGEGGNLCALTLE